MRVPKNVAGKLGEGTDKSRLVSTVLSDFFSQADNVDRTLNNLDLKERLEAAKNQGARNYRDLERLAQEYRRVKQEAANMKRSLFQSLRNAPPNMRNQFLALYKRVKDQETEAEEAIDLIKRSCGAMEAGA